MSALRPSCFICNRCAVRLGIFKTVTRSRRISSNYSTSSNATTRSRPLRLAVIGSGPAGFYAAYRVMSKLTDAAVDMYEKLPVPYGLVRFGVAPDHAEVKNCEEKFEEVAESPRFNFIGNIDVGHQLPLSALKPHYDAILFSYGASEDKRLGVPGEELKGIYSARAFVGWYNGLPEHTRLDPDLENAEEVVVVGQGNVALDVTRILLSKVDALRKTDITEYALEKLAKSRVKRVHVVGRRGPMQAAFTIKEVRELINLPSVAFHQIPGALFPADVSKLPRQQKRLAQALQKGSPFLPSGASRSWSLDFLLSPKAFHSLSDNPGHVASVECTKTTYSQPENRFSREATVRSTHETTSLPAQLAFRSVGYKSSPLPDLSEIGVPFDTKLGIIPNDLYGRVISPSLGPGNLSAGHVPGAYCAGWVKRGPTGVIASTMDDAFISADVIVRDWMDGVRFMNDGPGQEGTGLGWDGVKAEAQKRGLRRVSWEDWKRIDEAEKRRGAGAKQREKFPSVDDMLKVLDRQ